MSGRIPRRPQASFGPTGQKGVTVPASTQLATGNFDGQGGDDLFVYAAGSGTDTVWWGTTRLSFGTSSGDIGLTPPVTKTATYRYDTSGTRAAKTVGSGTEQQFMYTAAGGLPLLLGEHTGTSSTWVVYGPGGQPIEQIANDGSAVWLHHDQLGSVRLTTAAGGSTPGAKVSDRTYNAYGSQKAGTGTHSLLGYAGQYTDAETGYQYLRARFYDPATAQFLTRDPLVATTREPYGYGKANPSVFTDPSGLLGKDADPCTTDPMCQGMTIPGPTGGGAPPSGFEPTSGESISETCDGIGERIVDASKDGAGNANPRNSGGPIGGNGGFRAREHLGPLKELLTFENFVNCLAGGTDGAALGGLTGTALPGIGTTLGTIGGGVLGCAAGVAGAGGPPGTPGVLDG